MRSKLLALAPGAVLGLFIGRLLSEFWAQFSNSTPLYAAFLLTLISLLACTFLLKKIPLTKTWPALLLLIYVLYPEANWQIVLFTSLFTLLVWGQVLWGNNYFPQANNPGLFAAFLAILFFFIYLFTLAPDILPADSGEFQVVAANLGVAHPPGFSLYTMLAYLMTLLPVGPTAAYRVNLLSAVTSAISLGLVYASVYMITKKHGASILATIALGSATTFWAQSTTANIRSLSAMFAAIFFTLLIAYHKQLSSKHETAKIRERILILFALFLGLGLTHHASLVFMSIIFLLFLIAVDPDLVRKPQRWWRPFLAFLLGLLPILYFVFRATSGARGASPDLATLPGFLEHILALGFRGDLFTYLEPALLWERSKIMLNVLAFQFDPLLLIVMLIGLILLSIADWRLAFLLGGSFLVHTFVTATYRAPQTVEYMLPAYVPLVLLLGYAAGKSSRLWQFLKIENLQHILSPITLAALLIVAFWQMGNHLSSYQLLHRDTTARDYAQPLLENAPANSVILADWHWVTPFWYLQEVEGLRQDVTVRFVFPEGEPYAQTWAKRIAGELDLSRPVISTHFSPEAFHVLPQPEPIGEAYLFRTEPRLQMPAGYTPLDIKIGEKIQLVGYQIGQENVQAGNEMIVTVAWQSMVELDNAISLFAHLVDSNNQIFAQQDLIPNTQNEGLTLTQFRLTPRLDALPGEYSVLFGASDGTILLNESGQERTLLSSVTVLPKEIPTATNNPTNRRMIFDKSLRLIGYDWDQTLQNSPRLYLHWQTADGYQTEAIDEPIDSLPPYVGPWGVISNRWTSVLKPGESNYVPLGDGIVWLGNPIQGNQTISPNQSITLYQRFLSSQPVMRDYVVSARLIGFEEDGFHWAWWDLDDAVPAMGAIPTLKWISGSKVRSPHFLTVEPDAPGGQQVGGALTLYDAFTTRPLPILDERITSHYDWIPLGSTSIEN